jgi:hypothetical protein
MIHGRCRHVGVRPDETVGSRHFEKRFVGDRPGEAPRFVFAQGAYGGSVEKHVDVRADGVEVTADDGRTPCVALIDRPQDHLELLRPVVRRGPVLEVSGGHVDRDAVNGHGRDHRHAPAHTRL